MQINNLKLVNFRSYSHQYFDFNPRLNIIIGKNGIGKTNLVEAIYTLAIAKSFRTNNDCLLIKKDEKMALIKAEIQDKNVNEFKLSIENTGKSVLINDTKISRLSEYISQINVILFNPSDLKIIKDTPSIRRKMLNIEISQLDFSYLKYLQDYNKVLKQRNYYLKNKDNILNDDDFLMILTKQLINLGLIINQKRQNFITEINKYVSSLYYQITGLTSFNVKYVSEFNEKDQQDLLFLYEESLKRDVLFKKTHMGIHHDDLDFVVNNDSLKDFGSEGQQKNAIISFKLAELEVFYHLKQTYPILIFDDLFSELDKEKLNNILKLLNNKVQTFITTTEIDKINASLLNNCKIFNIRDKNVIDVEEVN